LELNALTDCGRAEWEVMTLMVVALRKKNEWEMEKEEDD
jgi:hypothetical protein